MIDFEHVSKQYKHNAKPALEDVNFHVDDGEFVFLLGHSGAGKSTLLKLILREETPTEGRVLVNGQDVARLRRRKIPYLRRQMGIIFQDFRLIPTIDFLRDMCERANVPVYAIGGINADNAEMALNAGADGVCVMSAIMQM